MRRLLVLAVPSALALTVALMIGSFSGEPGSIAHASTTCGYWRWPVKTGSDADRYKVSKTLSYTSIAYLRSIAKPTYYSQDHRVKWPEFRTWQINDIQLVKIKLEDDSDIHLIIRNSTGQEMVTEIPAPACVPSTSLWTSAIRNARAYITARYRVSTSYWTYVNRRVDIRGLGFFDEEHNVDGQAPNGLELHPVTMVAIL